VEGDGSLWCNALPTSKCEQYIASPSFGSSGAATIEGRKETGRERLGKRERERQRGGEGRGGGAARRSYGIVAERMWSRCREKRKAYAIVRAGFYKDDQDMGDSFIYTGSGGQKKRKQVGTCPPRILLGT
jgi:hypothetical protein